MNKNIIRFSFLLAAQSLGACWGCCNDLANYVRPQGRQANLVVVSQVAGQEGVVAQAVIIQAPVTQEPANQAQQQAQGVTVAFEEIPVDNLVKSSSNDNGRPVLVSPRPRLSRVDHMQLAEGSNGQDKTYSFFKEKSLSPRDAMDVNADSDSLPSPGELYDKLFSAKMSPLELPIAAIYQRIGNVAPQLVHNPLAEKHEIKWS